jgi:tryptophan 2,3-dioxygenase
MKYPPVHYHDYLQLDRLLSAQKRRSEELGFPAHDEMLFITVHQTYELWFKQIIFELDSMLLSLGKSSVHESELGTSVRRMERILGILRLSLGNIDVLETMTPLDFLDFRDALYPASGFQSVQFRLIETKLGLREPDRLLYNQTPFHQHLPKDHQKNVQDSMKEASLFDLVERWLERTPFLQAQGYDFWTSYKNAVLDMLKADRETVIANAQLSPEIRERNIKMIEGTEATFRSLFDPASYEELRTKGQFRLSAKALHAALFIQVYRDEPILQQAFRLLQGLLDLDEVMATWRYRHAQMAQRMLGRKIGTGGSSGHDYLRETADRHRIFADMTRLATFLIPRSKIPALPKDLREKMDFTKSF